VIARDVAELPEEAAISTATLAELHFGVHLARTDAVRAARLRRLTEIEARLEALPIDEAVARSYGALAQVVVKSGRKARARTMDILIAATAQANGVPLYTRNAEDFQVMASEIELRVV
jgi:toxin FitB